MSKHRGPDGVYIGLTFSCDGGWTAENRLADTRRFSTEAEAIGWLRDEYAGWESRLTIWQRRLVGFPVPPPPVRVFVGDKARTRTLRERLAERRASA